MCIVCLFITPEFSRQWWNKRALGGMTYLIYITVQSNLKLKTILWHKQQDGNLSLSLFLLIKWQIKGRKNCLDRSLLGVKLSKKLRFVKLKSGNQIRTSSFDWKKRMQQQKVIRSLLRLTAFMVTNPQPCALCACTVGNFR